MKDEYCLGEISVKNIDEAIFIQKQLSFCLNCKYYSKLYPKVCDECEKYAILDNEFGFNFTYKGGKIIST